MEAVMKALKKLPPLSDRPLPDPLQNTQAPPQPRPAVSTGVRTDICRPEQLPASLNQTHRSPTTLPAQHLAQESPESHPQAEDALAAIGPLPCLGQ